MLAWRLRNIPHLDFTNRHRRTQTKYLEKQEIREHETIKLLWLLWLLWLL
jgi:hypothetical protein